MSDAIASYETFQDSQQAKQDATLLVKFYVRPVPDKAETAQQGRAIFKDVEYVDIRTPGSRDAVARPASDFDKRRFARQYDAFHKRIEAPETGTPLVEWPLVSRSRVEELAFLGIKTVEALAALSDGHTDKMMGLGGLKRQAQEWLADAGDDAAVTKVVARLEATEVQLAARDKTISELVARLEALEGASKPDLHSPLDAPSAAAETDGDQERKRRRRRRTTQAE